METSSLPTQVHKKAKCVQEEDVHKKLSVSLISYIRHSQDAIIIVWLHDVPTADARSNPSTMLQMDQRPSDPTPEHISQPMCRILK